MAFLSAAGFGLALLAGGAALAHEQAPCALNNEELGYYWCTGMMQVVDDPDSPPAPEDAVFIEAHLARSGGVYEPLMIYDAESERSPTVPCMINERIQLRWRYLNELRVPIGGWRFQAAYCDRRD